MRKASQLTLTLLLVLLCLCQGSAQVLNATQVLAKVTTSQSRVQRLDAHADLVFDLYLGLLPYRGRLLGTYTFKAPDQHRLNFPQAPSYLKDLPNAFRWDLPSLTKYTCSSDGLVSSKNEWIYRLRYLPQNPQSKVSTLVVDVNAKTWKVLRQETTYRNGGQIELHISYVFQQGQLIPSTIDATIDLRDYHLKGQSHLRLTNHQVEITP